MVITPPAVFFLIAAAIDSNQWALVEALTESVNPEVFELYRTECDVGLTPATLAHVTVSRYYRQGMPTVRG